jgi:DNA-directed RNA polymerase subunit RPC12/RpoP
MMVDYKIDRFCGNCGIKVKNAVALNLIYCPDCHHLLRKKRYGRYRFGI